MDRYLTIFILLFFVLTTNAQIDKKELNMKFLKFYPIDLPEFIIDKPLYGQITRIDVSKDDTINYKLHFDRNRLSLIVFDSTKMSFKYRLGRLTRVENFNQNSVTDITIIHKILPFILVFNDGLNNTGFRLFSKTYKMKQLSGIKTFSKRKAKYKNGRIFKIKNYDWQTIAQHCYLRNYQILDYPNDTTVIERVYDSNDSLAFQKCYIFDKYGNILESNSFSRKRATGWGIDVTYFAYDANQTNKLTYTYKFDEYNNWIEKNEYLNDTLQSHEIRKIIYKE
jgi:hypothetical protein